MCLVARQSHYSLQDLECYHINCNITVLLRRSCDADGAAESPRRLIRDSLDYSVQCNSVCSITQEIVPELGKGRAAVEVPSSVLLQKWTIINSFCENKAVKCNFRTNIKKATSVCFSE